MNDSGQEQASRAVGPRDLPSVDRLLLHPVAAALCESGGRAALVTALREILAGLRTRLMAGEAGPQDISGEAILAQAATTLAREQRARLRPVLNATGIAVHTNLGRAPLAAEAVAAVTAIAGAYSNLEFDLDSGRRGSRNAGVEAMLCALTGCEAALVVNNCAAAILLALAAHARGGEVIVSRGELIEIGGNFRMPDVIAESGARLREVGTTNRTRLADFATAIGPDTRVLLSSHPSNYRVIGFTGQASLPELAALAQRHGVLCIQDLGSGALTRAQLPAGSGEPAIADSLAAGVDLLTFSGDKLLGGPQAGIILGRRAAVEPLRRHPLQRAVRIDKLSLAALQATLALYREGLAPHRVPVQAMLHTSPDALAERARRLAAGLAARPGWQASVIVDEAFAGGGAMPAEALRASAVSVCHATTRPADLLARLRDGEPPVIARIHHGQVIINLLAVPAADDASVERALLQAAT